MELGSVHTNDLEEARLQLKNPIETLFDVHLSEFIERSIFLASNDDTVSPVEIIRMLIESLKSQPPLHTWALRFNDFFSLPVNRTSTNFIAHILTGVRNLTSEEAGYAHALQRSDVQPSGRAPGRGKGGVAAVSLVVAHPM